MTQLNRITCGEQFHRSSTQLCCAFGGGEGGGVDQEFPVTFHVEVDKCRSVLIPRRC